MSIAIEGVVAGYTRDVPILSGVDLKVASGEIVTILGPNGSGKSTLLKTMMGFLRPSSGEITVDGESVKATPVHRRATECGIGIVPQLANVFGSLTVRQNLEIGGATLPRRERRRRIAELLDLYPRLRERQGQRADLQSGGERQMLAVARALMTRPGHLLLDEPSAGLSPLMLEELFDMLRELRDRDGTTLLVVEQNAAQSLKSSDRGVVLSAGRWRSTRPPPSCSATPGSRSFTWGEPSMGTEALDGAAVDDAVAGAGAALADGLMVLLLDDGATGAGYLLTLAESADAAAINFMATEARGLICLALSAERCEELRLEQILPRGRRATRGDSSMVSIEAREGVTTGISAADRARTIAVAIDPASEPDDLVQPGHVFPVRARPDGILEREAGVEAAVELAREAGGCGAGVFCQVMRDDGDVATGGDLDAFAARHDLLSVTVTAVAERRRIAAPPRPDLALGRRMRDVMGRFATGVSVVTARGEDGAPIGTTVNAISSVSLDPPLLLACLANGSETLAALRLFGRFAVNILADEQRHYSDRFAAKGVDAAAHEVDFVEHDSGVPLLPEALATIACRVDAIHPAGDHAIVVGAVQHLDHREQTVAPLLFYRGSYSCLQLKDAA